MAKAFDEKEWNKQRNRKFTAAENISNQIGSNEGAMLCVLQDIREELVLVRNNLRLVNKRMEAAFGPLPPDETDR